MIDTTGQQAAQLAYLSTPAPGGGGNGAATVAETAEGPGFLPFGADGFTFDDFIDIINPLQHIPIVSTLYRQMTGDQIDPGSRVGGGTLFGGPIGLVSSVINVIVDETTGKDVGEHVLALLEGEENAGVQNPQAINRPVHSARNADGDSAAARPWINPDAAPNEATFETAAGPAAITEESKNESPILEGMDVLLWAQLETAHRQRADAAGRAQTMQLADAGGAPLRFAALAGGAGGQETGPVAGWAETVDWAMRMSAANMAGPSDAAASNAAPGGAPVGALSDNAPAGAVAHNGGWFSGVMLEALAKYQQGAKLAEISTEKAARPVSR